MLKYRALRGSLTSKVGLKKLSLLPSAQASVLVAEGVNEGALPGKENPEVLGYKHLERV